MRVLLAAMIGLFLIQMARADGWMNVLSCDDGLRIDSGAGGVLQLVLFGAASQYFADVGAYSPTRLNENGEYVDVLKPLRGAFISQLAAGQLVVTPPFDRSNKYFFVDWQTAPAVPKANFKFYRCH